MMQQHGSPATQSAEGQLGPLRNEGTLEADVMRTDAVTAVIVGDSVLYAAAAPAVGDSGPSASQDNDSDVGGSEDHHGGSVLRYWIQSTVTEDQLEEIQSDGVLPAKDVCQWRAVDNESGPSNFGPMSFIISNFGLCFSSEFFGIFSEKPNFDHFVLGR